ncbi:MAG TPA: hypothetical protein VF761_16640 [Gemmatimonadaceae bacterium]
MRKIRKALTEIVYRFAAWLDWDEDARAEFQKFMQQLEECERTQVTVLPLALPELCERCERPIVIGYTVTRACWDAVATPEWGEHELCALCFDALARERHVRYVFCSVWPFTWYDVADLASAAR